MRRFSSALLLCFSSVVGADSAPAQASAPDSAPVYVAIIIDDIGNHRARGERAIGLQLPLTYSVLPHSPHARQLAQLAYQQGKEVMLHMPMANLGNAPLGPGALTVGQSHSEFIVAIDAAIKLVPHIRGINNHMGSQLTQQTQQMNWLMTEIKMRQMYFVDSRTTHKTVASRLARERHVMSSSRDVFLDNDQSYEGIHAAFTALLTKAQQGGTAIGIGHPYTTTIDYLARIAPELKAQNITLLPVSALIARQQHLLFLAKHSAIPNLSNSSIIPARPPVDANNASR